MPTIKCTAKLGKRAGFRLSPPLEQSPDDWHANSFTFGRRIYVIFVHDKTRLSCLAGPVKKADLQDLEHLLRQSLRTVLQNEGFSEAVIAHALGKVKEMNIAKTDNRSVLGTINDNISLIDYHAHAAGGVEFIGLVGLADKVNHMPMSPLKWGYAIEAYRRTVTTS